MTVLYIALIVIGIIGLLFILPITAVVSLAVNSDENEIVIKYLFLKLKLYPAKPKEETTGESDEGESEEKPKKNKKDMVSSVWVSKSDIKKGLSDFLYYIIRNAIIIKELNISAKFGFDNPMYTGLAAGSANGLVYNIVGLLDRHARLKKWSVDLQPNFNEPCMKAGVYCRLRTRIAHIFPLAAILLRVYVKLKLNIKKQNKKSEE